MKPTLFSVSRLLLVAVAALCSTAYAEVKVGFVYVGPIGDHGWTYQHDQGRLAVEAAGYEATYVESVPEGADAERVIRQLAQTGHNLIFTTSFGYMNPTEKVAKNFPDIKFEHATGFKRADNIATYGGRFYEGRHVAGLLAGKLTKSNKIGYVGSFPIPEVVRGINAALLAAQSVNPDATMHVVWVNSWFDPGKEANAANTLLDQGIDVLMQHTDSPAPMQEAAKRGVWAFGQASDMLEFGPDNQVTAIIDDWSGYYVDRASAVKDGSWSSSDTWGGLKSGMVRMGDYHPKLPKELVEMAQQAERDIVAGKLHPFTGPIMSREGEVKVAAGKTADDGLLLGMNFYVKGVVGSLPE